VVHEKGSFTDKYIIHTIIKLPNNLKAINSIDELKSLVVKGRNGNFINLISPFGVNLVNALSLNNWVDIE